MKLRSTKSLLIAALPIMIALSGCDNKGTAKDGLEFKTEYQAVLMDNGQAYFGKLNQSGGEFIQLNDVYYIQNRVDQETKAVSSLLVKRGQEWHAPDTMFISRKHVVIIEPVTENSKITQLIKDAKLMEKEEK